MASRKRHTAGSNLQSGFLPAGQLPDIAADVARLQESGGIAFGLQDPEPTDRWEVFLWSAESNDLCSPGFLVAER